MKLILAHLEDGGWECVVDSCRFRCEGRKDAEIHAERDHFAESFLDDVLDIYDIKDPADLRAMGLV